MLELDHFALSNFEGTLDFLLCLIQKEEIDIYDVSIQELLQQFIDKCKEKETGLLDQGAEFIAMASYLVLLKSKTLLPSQNECELDSELEIEDPRFEMIHHLLDYCRFKRAAKQLSYDESEQQAYYFRGMHSVELKKVAGVDHLTLDDLAGVFRQLLEKSKASKGEIQQEVWSVSDKIALIRNLIVCQPVFTFASLFKANYSRLEMIVLFLAILELMKSEELVVFWQNAEVMIGKSQEEKK